MKLTKYMNHIKTTEARGARTRFARRIGIHPNSLDRMLRGEVTNPKLEMLCRIKKASGGLVADVDDFDL